jgi:hypothetical protein
LTSEKYNSQLWFFWYSRCDKSIMPFQAKHKPANFYGRIIDFIGVIHMK